MARVPHPAGLVERHEGFPAVERLRNRQPRDINRLVVRRVDADLTEVHRPRIAIADVRPRLSLVVGAEDAATRRIEWRGRPRTRRFLSTAAAAAEAGARTGVVAPVVRDAPSRAPSARLRRCRRRRGARSAAATLSGCRGSADRGRHGRGAGGRCFSRRWLLRLGRRQRTADVTRFDLRVDDVGVRARHVERDAAVGAGRQSAAGELVPRLARVGALPDRAARAAAVEAARGAAALVARGVNDIRVDRIEDEVGEARVVVDELDVVPGLAAVGRLVDPALGIGSEQMPEHRRVHRVWILRVDDDARDRLTVLEAEMGEGLAAVGCLVDAVAERRRLAVVRLPGADVDDVGISRMDRDVADRRGGVGVEHRLERDGVVLGLPHAADRVAEINDVGIALRHLDVVDAPAHAGRTDRSEPETLQQPIGCLVDHPRRRRRPRTSLLRRRSHREHGNGERGERYRQAAGAAEVTGDKGHSAAQFFTAG